MMKLRSGLLILLLFITTACDRSAQVREIENPFPNASEVRLFVQVDYDKSNGGPIVSKPNGITLSAAERVRLEKALNFIATPDEMNMCYVPHHFFRYFDRNGKQIGEVEVCFCCAGTDASGSDRLKPEPDEILSADFQALEKLVLELGEPTQVLCN